MGCNCGKKREEFQSKLNNPTAQSVSPPSSQPVQPNTPILTSRQERILARAKRIERRQWLQRRKEEAEKKKLPPSTNT